MFFCSHLTKLQLRPSKTTSYLDLEGRGRREVEQQMEEEAEEEEEQDPALKKASINLLTVTFKATGAES